MRTPLRPSPWLSDATGADVWLKLETLQPTFSYKIRGALNAVLRLISDAAAPRALVTASAGNHGRALAYAARAAGLTLTVYVPERAPKVKLEAIRALGADLRPCADYDCAERCARQHGARGEALFISPYAHPDVIAGAGTVGLEILEERPDIDVIVVPVGGGGLISGIAIAARALSAATQVAGVEVEASCPFTRGLAVGRIVQIEVDRTLADGLAGNLDPDTVTFDIVRQLVSHIDVISEPDLAAAVVGVARFEKLIAEGAGAAGVAAVLGRNLDLRGRHAAVVLSGANIDLEVLRQLIEVSR